MQFLLKFGLFLAFACTMAPTLLQAQSRVSPQSRVTLMGKKLPVLKTTDGRVYKNATVLILTDKEMTLAIKNGVATVPYTKLPKQFRDRYKIKIKPSDKAKTDESAIAKSKSTRKGTTSKGEQSTAADSLRKNQLQVKVQVLNDKIARLKRDHEKAIAKAQNESVLQDKWNDKGSEYGSQAAKAEKDHRKARRFGKVSAHLATAKRAKSAQRSAEKKSEAHRRASEAAENQAFKIEDEITAVRIELEGVERSLRNLR